MDRTQRGIAGLLALALTPAFAATPNDGQVMIVLDGSGSMWGQIDGKPKLEIARETLAAVLADTPAGTELGLLAYGHRSKGDCKDIQLVVPAGKGTAPAIGAAAAKMKFLGMTPLSDAVTQAARELRHTERRATVVLITDGLETCKADPCAVGKALEESGVDFTAHVVGFGLSAEEGKQVACLAENTGGRYFAAGDAASLAAALSETVVEAPPAPPVPDATLEAPDSVPMSSRVLVTWTGPDGKLDDLQLFDPAARSGDGMIVDRQRLGSDKGYPQQQATVIAPAVPGDYQLRYYHGEQRKIIATRALKVTEAEVGLEAPEEVSIASRVTVRWTGPGGTLDDLELFDPRARNGDGQILDRQRLGSDKGFDQRQASVVAPAQPGEYELRYWNGDNRKVLATRVLRVVDAEVALEAPASVPAASRITVGWTGPGAALDDLEMFDPRARNGDGMILDRQRLRSDKSFEDRRATVVAPAKPGEYELRYWNGDNRQVLATRTVQVTPIEVSLSAPDRVAADSPVTVEWVGPGASLDNIEIYNPAARNGQGQVLVTRRVGDEGRTTLRAPKVAGSYELRYWNGDNRVVLATRPLIVE